MDVKLRNKIIAATTLVSLIIIGISIGVWSRRGEESKIQLYFTSNAKMNNVIILRFLSTAVDTFNPATAKIALGAVLTGTQDSADPGFCTGELTVTPPFRLGNIK